MSDLEISPDVRIVENEHAEVVLLHGHTGRWFLLNESGAALWRVLAAKKPAEEAVAVLVKRYPSVAPSRIRSDLQRLIEDLTRAGLIASPRVSHDPGNPSAVAVAASPEPARSLHPADGLTGFTALLVTLVLIRLPFWLCLRVIRTLKRIARRAATYDETMPVILAIRQIARFSPGRMACLELSLAATVASALRGRRVEWCIGTSSDPLRFHAWVEAGNRMVVHPSDEPADRSYRVALRV